MHFSLWKNNLRIIEFYENTRQKHYAEKMYANRRKRFSGRANGFCTSSRLMEGTALAGESLALP